MTESREFRTLSDVVMELLFLSILMIFTQAGSSYGAPPPDAATYEAITGESTEDDHTVWDSFYKKKNHAFGKEAVGFLRENLKLIRRGRAFVPGMGEGRNAIFLAKNGFQVEGVDLSQIAVDRAIEEAKSKKTQIKGVVGDLFQYRYPKDTYDFILVSLFYSPALLPKFKAALKKGGQILFYLKRDTGKPSQKVGPDDFLVKAGDLKASLTDFETLIYREYIDQEVDVVGILARKR